MIFVLHGPSNSFSVERWRKNSIFQKNDQKSYHSVFSKELDAPKSFLSLFSQLLCLVFWWSRSHSIEVRSLSNTSILASMKFSFTLLVAFLTGRTTTLVSCGGVPSEAMFYAQTYEEFETLRSQAESGIIDEDLRTEYLRRRLNGG